MIKCEKDDLNKIKLEIKIQKSTEYILMNFIEECMTRSYPNTNFQQETILDLSSAVAEILMKNCSYVSNIDTDTILEKFLETTKIKIDRCRSKN